MRKLVRLVVVAAASVAALAASACTELVGSSNPTWSSDATLDYEIDDGGAGFVGGGAVTARITGSTATLTTFSSPVPVECGDIPGFFGYQVCRREYSGTLTTQAGFIGDPGAWQIEMSAERDCEFGCDPGEDALAIMLLELRNPDGTDGLSTSPPVYGDLIDGTDGCSSQGVKFDTTRGLLSNPAVQATVHLVICSPGLAAHMAATRHPG
jgi:hypothetical protein